MKRFVGFLVALTLLASICLLLVFSQEQSELANQHKIKHRLRNDSDEDKNKDEHPAETGKAAKAAGNNGILYHGGPVILGTTSVYYIWYGNWGGNSSTTVLTNLSQNIGGSPYFNINTTYYNGSNTHVNNSRSLSVGVRSANDRTKRQAGADGMALIIAHELEETVTDPDLNAWYDRRGAEIRQMCLDFRQLSQRLMEGLPT